MVFAVTSFINVEFIGRLERRRDRRSHSKKKFAEYKEMSLNTGFD